MPYPNMLAGFNPNLGTSVPFELWAGEADIVTSQGTCGATALPQFQVIMHDNNGLIVPWDPSQTPDVGGEFASQNVTFTGAPAAGDTVTVGGTTITFIANGTTPAAGQVATGTDAPSSAAAFAAYVSANDTTLGVEAAQNGSVVRLTAVVEGVAGNSITLAKASTAITLGGATLAGGQTGTVTSRKPIGFTAQAAVPGGPVAYFTGGVPNHQALIWPAAVTSLNQRKAAFSGTNMTISSLL